MPHSGDRSEGVAAFSVKCVLSRPNGPRTCQFITRVSHALVLNNPFEDVDAVWTSDTCCIEKKS